MPASMLSGGSEHYALEVAGDSMIDAGILDGDTVIIQRCDTAENGAVVVALVDNEEVTLKRLRRRGEFNRARTGQQGVRNSDFWARPGQSSGAFGGADAPVLIGR